MISIILSLALLAMVQSDDEQVPVYDCNVPQGHFDKLQIDGSANNIHLNGVITAADLGHANARWAPAAGVLFAPPDGIGGVGLQVWRIAKMRLAVGVRHLGPGSDDPIKLGEVSIGQPIRFDIALESTGRLRVRVNDGMMSVSETQVVPTHPLLMCSGGHFRFTEMTVKRD